MERAAADLAESTRYDREWILKGDILPRIGSLRLDEITGADIVRMVEDIGLRSKVMARKAFSVVSVLFGHCVGKHMCKSNPCAGVKVSTVLGKRKPIRETKALTEAELRGLLAKVDSIGRSHGLAVRIILATAVRKIEMRLAKWEHLDLDAGLWSIPAEQSKNRRAFTIPLPARVVEWFRELQKRACGCPWVLPGQSRRGPISDATLHAAVCVRLSIVGVRHFTLHDLRRTARTHLARLGVNIIVAERCLNHHLGGLVAIYDTHDYT